MLRGSAIIFVAFLKHFALKDKLRDFMWVGVGWNVVSIILVGATAMYSVSGGEDGDNGKDPAKGVMLILAGAFVQSLQYAFEEKVKRSEGSERSELHNAMSEANHKSCRDKMIFIALDNSLRSPPLAA